MLRAIIVNVGTVAGVSAALLYQPQVEVLEFAGEAIGGGTEITTDQTQDTGGNDSNTPNGGNTNDSNQTTKPGTTNNNGKNKDKNKGNGTSPTPSSSSSGNPSPSASTSSPEPTKSATPTATPTPTPTKTKTPTPTPTPTPTSSGKDGTYAGSRVDVYYVDGGTKRKSGTLNIKVVIKSGKVAEIAFTEYPTGDHLKYTNHAYTQTAKPLIGLTIADLKAKKINTKTGATGTSTAFVTSLEAVLQQL